MRAIGFVTIGTAMLLLLLAPSARAERQWQCGDGFTVPLQGSRAEREEACRDAAARRDHPDAPITEEQAARLRQRIEQAEKQYDVDIKVEKLDHN